MRISSSLLRAQVESALRGRVPAPFQFRSRQAPERVPVGLAKIDTLAGGLPRGELTEILGGASCGRTTVLNAALAALTARGEVCALVDAQDAFDPWSAQAAGVELRRLLWVRCHGLEPALRAADLLLHSGGFGMIALDLSDLPPPAVRRVPLSYWFRFRRAVEDTPTVLLVLAQESYAQSCASLVVNLSQTGFGGSGSGIGEASPDSTNVCLH
jgi:recombination protein RecA